MGSMTLQEKLMKILKKHNVRITQNRMDILSVFEGVEEAVSQSYLEENLQGVDRITVYRTLKTFEKEGIIHQAIDGSGIAKYALCMGKCNHSAHIDDHAHFYCLQCDKTICVDNITASNINIPSGFQLQSAHLVLKGTCDKCISKN